MYVYICYQCYYDYCDQWDTVIKIVDTEEKAEAWVESFASTTRNWRKYEEMKVE